VHGKLKIRAFGCNISCDNEFIDCSLSFFSKDIIEFKHKKLICKAKCLLQNHRLISRAHFPFCFFLVDWRGNFDRYVRQREERTKNAMRVYDAYQSKREHMMEFIGMSGTDTFR
jgi:ATPase subunit of ABC transporter with duplicated ATPase domains